MFGSNPVFSQKLLQNNFAAQERLTVKGVFNKSLILFLILVSTSFYTWYNIISTRSFNPSYITISAILAFIVSLVIIFKPNTASYLSPVYAILEGVFISYISFYFNQAYPGVVTQAALATFAVVGLIIFSYSTGIFKVTPSFVKGVQIAMGAVFMLYLGSMIFSMFGMPFGFLYSSSPLGIGISLLIVALASGNILVNVHFIFQAERASLPSSMEWYLAFGLMVAVVWLYLEILRLFAKLRGRNR